MEVVARLAIAQEVPMGHLGSRERVEVRECAHKKRQGKQPSHEI